MPRVRNTSHASDGSKGECPKELQVWNKKPSHKVLNMHDLLQPERKTNLRKSRMRRHLRQGRLRPLRKKSPKRRGQSGCRPYEKVPTPDCRESKGDLRRRNEEKTKRPRNPGGLPRRLRKARKMDEIKAEQPGEEKQITEEPHPGKEQGQKRKEGQPIPPAIQLEERELLPRQWKPEKVQPYKLLQQPGPTKPQELQTNPKQPHPHEPQNSEKILGGQQRILRAGSKVPLRKTKSHAKGRGTRRLGRKRKRIDQVPVRNQRRGKTGQREKAGS
jgi:hypothetical protein